jgi:molybdopterin synthase catalytic subunit
MAIYTQVSSQDLSIDNALEFVDDAYNGAACLFVGRVRNHNLNRPVDGVTYDVYDELAKKEMQRICQEAQSNSEDALRLYMAHYKGYLPVGGISVIIATGSAHRNTAYSANRFMIEALKIRVPVWKSEHYCDGQAQWLEGNPLDVMP